MIKPIRILLFAIFCLLFAQDEASALNLSLAPRHYAEMMEFYYKEPKPELLVPMLRAYAQTGLLANGEKRMFVAAFLAELLKNKSLDAGVLAKEAAGLGREGRLTAAWSLHLSQLDAELAGLLRSEDALFVNQIKQSPSRLEDWDPAWETSVLGMYWGAFMASGKIAWVDRIIASALNAAGKSQTNRAAASLYESAPKHPLVAARIKNRLRGATPVEKAMLETIISRSGG